MHLKGKLGNCEKESYLSLGEEGGELLTLLLYKETANTLALG